MAIYKKYYIELVYDKEDIEFYPAYNVDEFYRVNPSTNELDAATTSFNNLKEHAYYIEKDSKEAWENRGWVGLFKVVNGELLEGTWFSKEYNVKWEKGDYIEDVEGDYPEDGIKGDFWYVYKEESEVVPPTVGVNIFNGGYIGGQEIKAMYRGSELIWESGGIPSYYELATDDDFEENGNYSPARFNYIGTKDYVILPETIHGKEYEPAGMFKGTGIKGVASRHDLQGSAYEMFRETTSLSLELTYLKTADITYMVSMFFDSKATSLDLSSFDTSNVTSMSNMFRGSNAVTLDLSSFDTSNVTDMDFMFSGSKATKGYARTQADADKFNNSSYKPSGLVFVVK